MPEEIEQHGGIPVRSQVGHSLIKKTMREQNIVFGGEHSGHFYFRDNWFADSGMIALLQCLEVFSDAGKPVSEVIAPIDTRFRSGEVNSRVHDIPAETRRTRKRTTRDARIDHLDGVTISYDRWWLNVRPSNTEPLLRLNVEGDTQALMEQHRDEALAPDSLVARCLPTSPALEAVAEALDALEAVLRSDALAASATARRPIWPSRNDAPTACTALLPRGSR